MENKKCIIFVVVIIIIAFIILFSSLYEDVSKISAVYSIKDDSKKTRLINPKYFNLISKMKIDSIEVYPCHTIHFKKGKHYVTFYIKKTKTTSYMFSEAFDLLSIRLDFFDASDVIDMSYMFTCCFSLEEVNLLKLKTNKVENMKGLFFGCSSLKDISFFQLNLESVENMEDMFYGCGLEKIRFSLFKTKNVTTTKYMFANCRKLKEIYINYEFETTNIVDMSYMFSGCEKLKYVDIDYFDTRNVEKMNSMFYGCSELTSISLKSFKTPKVKTMEQMFYNCENLKYLDISNFDTSYTPNILNKYGYFGTIVLNRSFGNKIKSQIGKTWSEKYID